MGNQEYSVVQSSKTNRYFAIPGNWRGIEREYAADYRIRVEAVASGLDKATEVANDLNRKHAQIDPTPAKE